MDYYNPVADRLSFRLALVPALSFSGPRYHRLVERVEAGADLTQAQRATDRHRQPAVRGHAARMRPVASAQLGKHQGR